MPNPIRRRTAVSLAAVLIVSTVLVVPVGGPEAAATTGSPDDIGPFVATAELAPDDALDGRLLHLDLDGSEWAHALRRLDEAMFHLAEAERALARAVDLDEEVRRDLAEVGRNRHATATELGLLEPHLLEVDDSLTAQTVDLFVGHGQHDMAAFESVTADADAERSRSLTLDLADSTLLERDDLVLDIRRLQRTAASLDTRAEILQEESARASELRQQLAAVVVALEQEVPAAQGAIVTTRRAAIVPGLGLSVTTLDAYLDAERLLARDRPGCGLEWWMIAGVARIESWHGTIGGRSIRADGRPSSPIIGIPLDGRPGVREILDTDDGTLDGDTVHDRAVGPLQFIPETWRRLGRDANGDGTADPQSLHDAAYSTGRYLCSLGGNLTSTANLRSAYFGYNTSTEYVDAVHSHAVRYAEFSLPAA